MWPARRLLARGRGVRRACDRYRPTGRHGASRQAAGTNTDHRKISRRHHWPRRRSDRIHGRHRAVWVSVSSREGIFRLRSPGPGTPGHQHMLPHGAARTGAGGSRLRAHCRQRLAARRTHRRRGASDRRAAQPCQAAVWNTDRDRAPGCDGHCDDRFVGPVCHRAARRRNLRPRRAAAGYAIHTKRRPTDRISECPRVHGAQYRCALRRSPHRACYRFGRPGCRRRHRFVRTLDARRLTSRHATCTDP